LRYQLHSKSLLGLCALSVVVVTACSDDFPSSNASSDYLVTLDVTPDHHGVNEELTLTCTVTHDGDPVDDLSPELRYTHLGAGHVDDHASPKSMHGEPCVEGAGGHGGVDGHGGVGGHDEGCEPGNHVEMMHGAEPGTYVGRHAFDEVGDYEIEFEFEGHDGPELHHFNLAIEDGGDSHGH
jgi:hypothetical protein